MITTITCTTLANLAQYLSLFFQFLDQIVNPRVINVKSLAKVLDCGRDPIGIHGSNAHSKPFYEFNWGGLVLSSIVARKRLRSHELLYA